MVVRRPKSLPGAGRTGAQLGRPFARFGRRESGLRGDQRFGAAAGKKRREIKFKKDVMTQSGNRGATRTIFRWIHIVFAIPILGYIYSPFDKLPNYAPATRFVFVPAIVVSGLWMWKGHVVRRLISKRLSSGAGACANPGSPFDGL